MNVYDSIINQSPVSTPENENEYVCLKSFHYGSKAGKMRLAERGDIISIHQNEGTEEYVKLLIEKEYIANSNQLTDGIRQYVISDEWSAKKYGLHHLKFKIHFDGLPIPVFIILPADNSKVGEEYLELALNGVDLHERRKELYEKSEKEFLEYKASKRVNLYNNQPILELGRSGEDLLDYTKELLQH